MKEIKEIIRKDFPLLLKEIPDKPKKLYYRGEIPDWENNKFLAIVGSRKYSDYGKSACQKLIEGLRGYPIIIVSGLALGIDSIANESALRAGLKTIAVPGSGIGRDAIYPPSHAGLSERILKAGGLLLSEFEPNQKSAPYMFPQRNRIMAGMSHSTLVVEAEKESGTLITARLSMEYNRDVLTIPGSIFSSNTEGPHYLIKNGATPIRESADILEALHIPLENKPFDISKGLYDLSDNEIKVLEILKEPKSKEDLIELINMEISELNSLLSVMEIKGLVQESLGEIRRL